MQRLALPCCILFATLHRCAWAQSAPAAEQRTPQPLYQVTIVARTTKAINYGYLSAPTSIGFRGTPVAPFASGVASIEPKRGATLVNLKLKDMPVPGRFGPQYLSYVVWAISLDGRAQNLGELILDGSTKGKLSTSTPLQAFALIVTAEPHYAVMQPGDVVVLENVVIPETIGKVQEVNATYELLPRQPYIYNTAAGEQPLAGGRQVGAQEYEATTALYQALNAIQIAQSQNADRYAPDQMSRARQIYNKARGYPVQQSKEIVSMSREATQIAEDARVIALKRAAAAAEQVSQSSEQGSAAWRHEAEKSVLQQPQPEAYVAPPPPPPPQQPQQQRAPTAALPQQEPPAAAVADRAQQQQYVPLLRGDPNARENRRRLLAALPRDFEVLDSSRGVIITIPEQAAYSSSARSYFSAVAAAIRPYPRLVVNVEAHSSTPDSFDRTRREAMRVRDELISAGISPDIILPRGYGDSRPRSSNATPSGVAQNRRVEILIAGDPIGTLAMWDRSYKLQPSAQQRRQ